MIAGMFIYFISKSMKFLFNNGLTTWKTRKLRVQEGCIHCCKPWNRAAPWTNQTQHRARPIIYFLKKYVY